MRCHFYFDYCGISSVSIKEHGKNEAEKKSVKNEFGKDFWKAVRRINLK